MNQFARDIGAMRACYLCLLLAGHPSFRPIHYGGQWWHAVVPTSTGIDLPCTAQEQVQRAWERDGKPMVWETHRQEGLTS